MSPLPNISTLSLRRRRFYFRLTLVLFVIAAPVLFLYATGYRFEGLTVWTKTGGISVSAEQRDAEVYLDGELIHETTTFRRSYYIDNLEPNTYTVRVAKKGYHSWEKTLPVYEYLVTEAEAFNLPEEPLLVLVPPTLTTQTQNATTTVVEPNPLYEEIAKVFMEPAATSTRAAQKKSAIAVTNTALRAAIENMATTTKESRGMQLFEDGDHVAARWVYDLGSIPFYFCIGQSGCLPKIPLVTGEKPSYFDFFPGTTDLAIVRLKAGIFVIELDNRSKQNIQPLFPTPGADFRVTLGGIYVKTPSEIYKVEI